MLKATELSIKKYAARLCGSAPGVAAAVATPRRCDVGALHPPRLVSREFRGPGSLHRHRRCQYTAASSTRLYEMYWRGKPQCNDSDFVPITRRCFRTTRDASSAHPTVELISSILTPIVTGVNSAVIYNYILKKNMLM